MGVLERGGCRLHYWVDGPGDAIPVVLTHGATADHGMFEFQAPVLVEAGYRVITWDVRGHGLSKPIGRFTIATAADDLVALLDELGIDRAVLVGQSMGGNIVQEVLFAAPDRARAAVIIGSACNTAPLTRWDRAQLAISGPTLRAWPFGALKRSIVQRSAVTPHARADLARAVALVDKREFMAIWLATARCLHPEPGYRIDVPLLLVRGEHDKLGNFEKAMPRWAARDSAHYEVLARAGHVAQQDAPQAFNQVIVDFLYKSAANP